MESGLASPHPWESKTFCLESIERSYPLLRCSRMSSYPKKCSMSYMLDRDVKYPALLIYFSRAKEIWSELGLTEEINKAVVQDRSGSVTLEIPLRTEAYVGEIPKAEMIAVTAWYIWWQRRQIVRRNSTIACSFRSFH